MILADSTVWIDHLRKGDPKMLKLLENDLVVVHPFVIGEIALGHLKRRRLILEDLNNMRQVAVASDAEVLTFIETSNLVAAGVGFVDVHLLASAMLSAAKLWTRDKRLARKAEELGLAAQ